MIELTGEKHKTRMPEKAPFAAPVLTYLAQLMPTPQPALDAEEVAMLKTVPGPNKWISTTDLIWLQKLTGHPRSLTSLKLICQAAQTRVRVWDPACADHQADPGTPMEWCEKPTTTTIGAHTNCQRQNEYRQHRLPNNLTSSSTFQKRARYLRRLSTAPEEPYTKAYWSHWFSNSMLLTLESNLEAVQQKIGPVRELMTRKQPTNDQQRWQHIRRKFQSWVYTALHQKSAPDIHTRFAHKLGRWKLDRPTQVLHDHLSVTQRTPNWQARCAHQRLKTIAKLTTPRVHAAVYGAMWNRWCTLGRFRNTGRCRLCQQPRTKDSIEHYTFCSTVRKLASRRLRLCCTTQVNIHTFTCTNPLIRTQEQLSRAALLIYATYRALNHQRHSNSPLPPDELFNAMCQWVVEGARGHARTCQTLASTWSEHQGTPLPRIQ